MIIKKMGTSLIVTVHCVALQNQTKQPCNIQSHWESELVRQYIFFLSKSTNESLDRTRVGQICIHKSTCPLLLCRSHIFQGIYISNIARRVSVGCFNYHTATVVILYRDIRK